jgi:signal transduction histidine kinase
LVRTWNGGVHTVLSVADTGIGIGPADLPRIFDRFYRTDKVRSRVGGHAGLGLSICKAILDAEGGTIQVESEIGKGTVFTVRLPFAIQELEHHRPCTETRVFGPTHLEIDPL